MGGSASGRGIGVGVALASAAAALALLLVRLARSDDQAVHLVGLVVALVVIGVIAGGACSVGALRTRELTARHPGALLLPAMTFAPFRAAVDALRAQGRPGGRVPTSGYATLVVDGDGVRVIGGVGDAVRIRLRRSEIVDVRLGWYRHGALTLPTAEFVLAASALVVPVAVRRPGTLGVLRPPAAYLSALQTRLTTALDSSPASTR